MYKIGSNLALLALGSVLVMTAIALVPRANAQLVDADIANVDQPRTETEAVLVRKFDDKAR